MTYSKLINHGGKTVSYAGARLQATMDMWFSLFLFQANIPAATVTYRNLCNAVPDPEYSRVGLDACGPLPGRLGMPLMLYRIR